MRLSLQNRNPVKRRSASVEFANQTGDRILTVRLEFNYKTDQNCLRHDIQILNLFFVGLANSLFFCWRVPTPVCNCRTEVKKLTIVEWEADIVRS